VSVRPCLDNECERRRRDPDFWAKIARAFEYGNLEVVSVVAARHDLQGGSWEDLRAIWDALYARANDWYMFLVTEVLFDNSYARTILVWDSQEWKEKVWKDFQLILDTPPRALARLFERRVGCLQVIEVEEKMHFHLTNKYCMHHQ